MYNLPEHLEKIETFRKKCDVVGMIRNFVEALGMFSVVTWRLKLVSSNSGANSNPNQRFPT